MAAGIVEIDLHGMNYEEAKRTVDKALSGCGSGTYRLRVIHGYHGGTNLKRMLQEEYGYGRCQKVLRIQPGSNQGITELVLREF